MDTAHPRKKLVAAVAGAAITVAATTQLFVGAGTAQARPADCSTPRVGISDPAVPCEGESSSAPGSTIDGHDSGVPDARPPALDLGCGVQCITSVDVELDPNKAAFTITTSEDAYLTLMVHSTTENDKWAESFGATQNWKTAIHGLHPNTTYPYVVTAYAQGHESIKTGTFTTCPC